jgi:hypothetical protein
MRKLIFAIMVGLLSVAPASTYAGPVPPADCGDERCVAAHNPQPNKPAVPDMVCIFLVQPSADTVVLSLQLKNGTTRRYSRVKQANDSICINRLWVRESTWVNLCNTFTGSADYFGVDLKALAVKSQYSTELTACLFGDKECKTMGFKSWSDLAGANP